MGAVFLIGFVAGAAALAVWVDVRLPRLAPRSPAMQMAVAGAAFVWLRLPVDSSSMTRLLLTLFAGLLPAFVTAFLAAIWLLRSLRATLSAM